MQVLMSLSSPCPVYDDGSDIANCAGDTGGDGEETIYRLIATHRVIQQETYLVALQLL